MRSSNRYGVDSESDRDNRRRNNIGQFRSCLRIDRIRMLYDSFFKAKET